MAGKVCCICRRSGKKNPKSYRKSTPYESDFQCCFGPGAENRSGWLCPTCRDAVATQYRKDGGKTFYDLLDSKGATGFHGHSKHGTSKLTRPLKNVINTPRCLPAGHDHSYHTPSPISTSHPTSAILSTHRLSTPTPCLNSTTSSDTQANLDQTPIHARCNDGFRSITSRKRLMPTTPNENGTSGNKRMFTLEEIYFFHTRPVPKDVVNKILGYCNKEDIVNIKLASPSFRLNDILFEELSSRYDNIKTQHDSMSRKTTIPSKGPLTQPQKELLSQLIRNRQQNLDKDGLLVVGHRHGKPTKLLEVPNTQQGSSTAAPSTKVRRSKLIEKVTSVLSMVSGKALPPKSTVTDENIDIHSQRVSVIKRNKSAYADAAKEAGLNVVGRFTKETVLALRAAMTQTMWRMIRKTLRVESGHDVLMKEGQLKEEIRDMEYEYECGTHINPSGEETPFVRVVDVKEVVNRMVSELCNADFLEHLANIPEDTLWLHVSADKGGKSTKLILQVINVNEKGRHSIKHCKILGFFEGKDNRQNIEEIFGPTLKQLQTLTDNISELNLKRPTFASTTQRKPAPGELTFYLEFKITSK